MEGKFTLENTSSHYIHKVNLHHMGGLRPPGHDLLPDPINETKDSLFLQLNVSRATSPKCVNDHLAVPEGGARCAAHPVYGRRKPPPVDLPEARAKPSTM